MSGADILTLGEPLIEMTRLPAANGPPIYQQGVSGDVLNVAVAAARQGSRAGIIGAVGGAPFGEDIRAFCKTENVETSALTTRRADPTGVCFIDPDPSERRFSYARRGAAASLYGPADLPVDLIEGAEVLHVSAISQAISPTMQAAVRRAATIALAAGTLVSYDLNLRLQLWPLETARRAIEDLLPLADIVLPSDDEAALLLGTHDPEAQLDHFGRHGARWVALKRGANGVVLQGKGTRVEIEAPKVEAVDSAGAGDSFAGAFLTHLLASGDGEIAARHGVEVAAQVVAAYGATAPIPRAAC